VFSNAKRTVYPKILQIERNHLKLMLPAISNLNESGRVPPIRRFVW
jgi:hypothetical protein